MTIASILEKYETSLLDQISSDKIDQTISLRLPRTVIIQEIISALGSLSYIAAKVTYGKPPLFAMLNLILNARDHTVEVQGFRGRVLDYIQELSARAEKLRDFRSEKNHQLYFKILKRAWEDDGVIDNSEGRILELVKYELGIWDREHFVLAHHPSILKLWDMEQEFYTARNFLLRTGIILTDNDNYVIADEVVTQIRRSFGVDLMDATYRRLLNSFTKEELAMVLGNYALFVSGSKEEMIERLLNALIPAQELLNVFSIEGLREFCRKQLIAVSGTKYVVIGNIIEHFDEDRDIAEEEPIAEEPLLPAAREEREMDAFLFSKVLLNLSNQQLYDCLYQCHLHTSGTKEEKVKRLVDSPWSERSIFNHLRKDDLSLLCRKFEQPVSGAKQELIDRLLDIKPDITIDPVVIANATSVTGIKAPATADVHTNATTTSVAADLPIPAGLGLISEQFKELDYEEQIIVAVLKESKSLTEEEIERVAAKYGLSWFLYKAHMSEMIGKLKSNGKEPIRVKSVQHINLYQWSEESVKTDVVLERKSARDIIDALRHGVVPNSNLDLLMVGQAGARRHLAQILGEVNSTKSHFKFIRGQYGSGKTFLCSWLKEYALRHEYAVSFLNISHDQPHSDHPIFFSGMINGLRTPEKNDSSALMDIIESWLLAIHKRALQMEGIAKLEPRQRGEVRVIVEKNIDSQLSKLNDIEPAFGHALRTFYKAKFENNPLVASNVVSWITGSRSLSLQTLREIGVKGYLEANNVFPRMRAILEIINGARYKGLLLVVDELELVRKFPHVRQREQAFETLRLLIDETGRNGLAGSLLIFTGTDEFFEDERYGLKSYAALAERVLSPLDYDGLVSMRQPIISLEALDRERLAQVIFKIRDLYALAYNWDAPQFANDAAIQSLIESWTMFGEEAIDRKPRPILREFIQILDLCEENKGVSIEDFLKHKNFIQPEVHFSSFN
jgi:hypothetical protein